MSKSTIKAFLFAIAGIVYLLLPTDVIPDFLAVIGRVDDIIVLGYLYMKWRNMKKEAVDSAEPRKETSSSSKRDPYQILQLERNAKPDEIEKAYRKKASEYHPDKVEHLGDELKKLAHEKMLDVQWAYQELKTP